MPSININGAHLYFKQGHCHPNIRIYPESNVTLNWILSCALNGCKKLHQPANIATTIFSKAEIHNTVYYTGGIAEVILTNSSIVTVSFVNVSYKDAGVYYIVEANGLIVGDNHTVFVWGMFQSSHLHLHLHGYVAVYQYWHKGNG